ncbi:ATP-dependent DNA ligase [Rubinisphaera brasiliensis]|uniref:DNA ligase (ATP) n=1 Tax=Rubinisphaera brasiliensis (strain ATCC 49424 / DSM 5305 / JCM 21570 / IAM 15109 / NBRC 103401 / IFAM 1448) TaxID=756272 RepID=F0SQ31_RUBBR|nr:ATP-dependent DNA ligase [Rubinisphaera brasiliensis]ADY61208.1 ATP dependent DNA ligase [Rubinisphaera brasiliensis DSM 5305]
MKRFCELFRELDGTTKTSRRHSALQDYFREAPANDAAWATYILSGRRLKRLVKHGDLRAWGAELAELPDWLFEECYHMAGDLAETIALVIHEDRSRPVEGSLTHWMEEVVAPLGEKSPEEQRTTLQHSWSQLDAWSRFVFNKLITGGLRIGVSQRSVVKALAATFEIEPNVIAHRLMGPWEPTAEFFEQLVSEDAGEADLSQPYPFCLAHPFDAEPESLGAVEDWLADWKWDGIRAQAIRRGQAWFLWSRGEELLNERFPDFDDDLRSLPPGTVLDGELVGWKDGQVLPFGELQKRIARKRIGPKILRDVPVKFIAFDVLEHQGQDIRDTPMRQRRDTLERLLVNRDEDSRLMISPAIEAANWEEMASLREQSRELGVEGIMLKHTESAYQTGRVSGSWWKWKIAPYTIDAVLIYAQAGHGRRASLYTDYTFALWDGDTLVPFAKAYSGLTDAEIRKVDKFIRSNTQERFGPVRSVKAELVFELAFENIQESTRHKSGVAVRFPRIHRWRQDKPPEQANTLQELKAMMPAQRLPLLEETPSAGGSE